MAEPNGKSSVSPALVALAGWVVPGAGYWLIGQRSRAMTVSVTIFVLFIMGLLIGGMHVVDAPVPITQVLTKPWFIGQALAGPIGIIAAKIANAWQFPMSHAALFDVGTLYTAVAGMLNLLTIMDAAYRAAMMEAR